MNEKFMLIQMELKEQQHILILRSCTTAGKGGKTCNAQLLKFIQAN